MKRIILPTPNLLWQFSSFLDTDLEILSNNFEGKVKPTLLEKKKKENLPNPSKFKPREGANPLYNIIS